MQYWSHQNEPEEAKSNDKVIRKNLDRIPVSAATQDAQMLIRNLQLLLLTPQNSIDLSLQAKY